MSSSRQFLRLSVPSAAGTGGGAARDRRDGLGGREEQEQEQEQEELHKEVVRVIEIQADLFEGKDFRLAQILSSASGTRSNHSGGGGGGGLTSSAVFEADGSALGDRGGNVVVELLGAPDSKERLAAIAALVEEFSAVEVSAHVAEENDTASMARDELDAAAQRPQGVGGADHFPFPVLKLRFLPDRPDLKEKLQQFIGKVLQLNRDAELTAEHGFSAEGIRLLPVQQLDAEGGSDDNNDNNNNNNNNNNSSAALSASNIGFERVDVLLALSQAHAADHHELLRVADSLAGRRFLREKVLPPVVLPPLAREGTTQQEKNPSAAVLLVGVSAELDDIGADIEALLDIEYDIPDARVRNALHQPTSLLVDMARDEDAQALLELGELNISSIRGVVAGKHILKVLDPRRAGDGRESADGQQKQKGTTHTNGGPVMQVRPQRSAPLGAGYQHSTEQISRSRSSHLTQISNVSPPGSGEVGSQAKILRSASGERVWFACRNHVRDDLLESITSRLTMLFDDRAGQNIAVMRKYLSCSASRPFASFEVSDSSEIRGFRVQTGNVELDFKPVAPSELITGFSIISVPAGATQKDVHQALVDEIPSIARVDFDVKLDQVQGIARVTNLDPDVVDRFLANRILRIGSAAACRLVELAHGLVFDLVPDSFSTDDVKDYVQSQASSERDIIAHISAAVKNRDGTARFEMMVTDGLVRDRLVEQQTARMKGGVPIVVRPAVEFKLYVELNSWEPPTPSFPESNVGIQDLLGGAAEFRSRFRSRLVFAQRDPSKQNQAVLWFEKEESAPNPVQLSGGRFIKEFTSKEVGACFGFGELAFDHSWYSDRNLLDLEPRLNTTSAAHDMDRKWKADLWLECFKRKSSTDHKNRSNFLHALRRTVMIATYGAVLRGHYESKSGRNVLLNLPPRAEEPLLIKDPLNDFLDFELKAPTVCDVEVQEMDCFLVAKDMQERYAGSRVLVLNMASHSSPGGGYLSGDGAQEENLFRRSNYYQSLDRTLHQKVDPELYPLHRYSALLSRRVCVFRGTEDEGYPFLDQPFEVDCLAVAAQSRPKLERGRGDAEWLSAADAADARRRIQTIFAAGALHGYDSLVLSAFGCGAFRNPPRHIAQIFQAVAFEFAGYFRRITFAIVNDHNARGLGGNSAPFREVFRSVKRIDASPNPVNKTVRWSYALPVVMMDDGSDGDPPKLPTQHCQHGLGCEELDVSEHALKFAHPPFCRFLEKCELQDRTHLRMWRHPIPCPARSSCKRMQDDLHALQFTHPDFCKEGGHCDNTDKEHLQEFRHVPVCKSGTKCPDFKKGDPKHRSEFRHIFVVVECTDGFACRLFRDPGHMDEFSHPFLPVCPKSPSECKGSPCTVGRDLSHICMEGMQCKKFNADDSGHMKRFFHVARCQCVHEFRRGSCPFVSDEQHLTLYSHKSTFDVRIACRDGPACKHRHDPKHSQKFAHSVHVSASTVEGLCGDVDFKANVDRLITKVNELSPNGRFSLPPGLRDWIMKLKPVHRCNVNIFESVALCGHLISRQHMDDLADPRVCVEELLHHPALRKEYFSEKDLAQIFKPLMEEIVYFVYKSREGLSAGTSEREAKIETKKKTALTCPGVTQPKVDEFHALVRKVAEAAIALPQNKMGIGHSDNKVMGTDRQVFSILGPHTGIYYGAVTLILNPSILSHPDFNVTPQSGTPSFSNNANAAWLNPNDVSPREAFDQCKINASTDNWALALGADRLMRSPAATTLDEIEAAWYAMDSHDVFEAHLPARVPLSSVEKIIIPKDLWKKVIKDKVVKQRLEKTFGGKDGLKRVVEKVSSTEDVDTRRDNAHKVNVETLNLMKELAVAKYPLPRSSLGFRFALDGDVDQLNLMPGTLGNPGHIYFGVLSHEKLRFSLTLSTAGRESMDGAAAIGAKNITVQIRKNALRIAPTIPTFVGDRAQDKDAVEVDDFNLGLDPKLPIVFHVCVKGSTLIVEHAAPSVYYNNRVAKFENLDFTPKHVYVGADKHEVEFSGFCINNAEIPTFLPDYRSRLDAAIVGPSSAKRSAGKGGSSASVLSVGSAQSGFAGALSAAGTVAGRECRHGIQCSEIFREGTAHLAKFEHPFWAPLCKRFPAGCSNRNCEFAHGCRYGKDCRDRDNHEHTRKFLHDMTRQNCKDGQGCRDPSFRHRAEFHHPGLEDFPVPCRDGDRCRRRSEPRHCSRFTHAD